jgi:hypothetical protein
MSPDEIDERRQEYSDQLASDIGSKWADQNAPGSFGCHELLDRTAMLAAQVDELILAHPACVRDAEWFALAQQAAAALSELYQRVGAEHLSDNAERA